MPREAAGVRVPQGVWWLLAAVLVGELVLGVRVLVPIGLSWLQPGTIGAADRASDTHDAPPNPGAGSGAVTGQPALPGEAAVAEPPLPPLDEARGQFMALAEAADAAAGPSAMWSDELPLTVHEEVCEGGIRLRLTGEFTTGVITDTTSDEHDREVTARNIAAAGRIAEAWHRAGLGVVERLHDEPLLGGGGLGAVEHATVDFAFGVAQPRVEGRCLPAR